MESEAPEVIERLYGVRELATPRVLHVTAAVRTHEGSLRVLAIGPSAPPSDSDFFLLNLARARADVVLTTGSILRAEPSLRVAIQGAHAQALQRHRREVLGKLEPPVCAIMTRDGALPRDHGLWGDPARKLVLTAPQRVTALTAELHGRAEVIGVPDLDARTACLLLHERGAQTVSIEAGPSANAVLYEAPALVDELSLSLYEGPLQGVPLAGALSERLTTGMSCASDVESHERSGRWRYQRWLRA